jgi:hypothetical protein
MDRDSPSKRDMTDHARRELEQAIAQLDRVNRFLALGTTDNTDPLDEINRAKECLRRARLKLSTGSIADPYRRIVGLLAALMLLVAPNPAQAISAWNTQCRSIVMQLKSKPNHKALVVGRVTEGEYCMAVWSASSRAVAEREALKRCEAIARSCVVQSSQ